MQSSRNSTVRTSMPEASDTTPAQDMTSAIPTSASGASSTTNLDLDFSSLLPEELLADLEQDQQHQQPPPPPPPLAAPGPEPGLTHPFSTLPSFSSPGLLGGFGQGLSSRTPSTDSAATGTTRRLTSAYTSLSFSSPPVPSRLSLDSLLRSGAPAATVTTSTSTITSTSGALGDGAMRNPFRVSKEEQQETTPLKRSSLGLFASERASKRDDDDDDNRGEDQGTDISATLINQSVTPQRPPPLPQGRLSGGSMLQQNASPLPGGVGQRTPSIPGGLGRGTLGGPTASNSPFRGLSSIGGGAGGDTGDGNSGAADPLTPGDRGRNVDLQVEKSRLLEQLRNMRVEVDDLEARLQALRRKKARSSTVSAGEQQRKLAKEALDMRKFLYKLNSTAVTPIKKSLDEESKRSKRDRTSLISNGQLFRSSVSTSSMSGLDYQLLRQLGAFTNITFTQIRSQLQPFEEPSTPTMQPSSFSRLEDNTLADINDDDDGILITKSRYYHYQGSCYQLDFDVKFVVKEPDLILEGLAIKVPTGVEAELGTFLEKAEKDSDLLRFFRTFHRYAQMNYQRKKLWNNFAKRYPRLVSMATINKDHPSSSTSKNDDGDDSSTLGGAEDMRRKRKRNEAILPGRDGVQLLTFCGPRRTDMELVLNWRIHVDQHGQLTPLLRLLPKTTSFWKQADQKTVVENLPNQFLRLMEMKGVEGAVVTILKSVYGQEAMARGPSTLPKSESAGDQERETEILSSSDEQ